MSCFTRLADLLATGLDMDTALRLADDGTLVLKDGITAPSAQNNSAVIYVDTADGDLKVKFADGTITVIAADT